MVHRVAVQRRRAVSLLSAQQDQALRNLLHGRIAREVADALFSARELVDRMNRILKGVTSSQGIGVRLDWRPRGDLDPETATALELLGKHPDLRSPDEDDQVREAVKTLVEQARTHDPEASYRSVIGEVLDYRTWHEMRLYLRRPGRSDELLTRRTTLSEGEKKLVTVLPMAAAAAASAAAHDPHGVGAPRLVLLDDAFAKVSEDNHAKLFGLLVDLDVDFVVTSERLWGTHPNVPGAGDHRGAARPGAAGHRARALPVGRGFPGGQGVTGVRTSVFAYVTESPEYRAILSVFAGTFFAELTPAEVTAQLDTDLDEATVTARLEALRGWGNLEVSASVGQVGTVEDYYRRRNRYLITRVGQEVHDVVEGVLSQVDDVRDVSLGRLDQVRAGLDRPRGPRRRDRTTRPARRGRARRVRPARRVLRRRSPSSSRRSTSGSRGSTSTRTSSRSSPRCSSATSASGSRRCAAGPARSARCWRRCCRASR